MTTTANDQLEGLGTYKFGWADSDVAGASAKRGLSEAVVRDISARKDEPAWMLENRLKGLKYFGRKPMPSWGSDLSGIDFDNIKYFVRSTEKQAESWDDLPADIKNTYDKLGIPEAEKQRLISGVAAQYESEVVYHKIREDLEEKGVIFLDTDSALKQYPDLFREYYGTVIPAGDNKFAALNTATWSGGSFIYVQKGVYDEFAKRFAEKVKGFKLGAGFDEGITHGPVIHERAVNKVHEHVQDAISKGAKLAVGGEKAAALGPNFYHPTVLTGMTKEMLIASEETFGPVAGLFAFDTEKEVVDLANKAEVGLAGYFFSGNVRRIFRVAEALEVGMVGVNTGLISDVASPFGGVKQSGFGREGSKYGIDEFMTIKSVTFGGMGEPLQA